MNQSDSEEENVENEVQFEGTTFTRLTDLVRQQYVRFLKKQLKENLRACWQEAQLLNEDDQMETVLQECAKHLEDLAIKEATLTQLYQRAMLKTIANVRHCTEESRLADELQVILNTSEPKIIKCSKATQTEDYIEAAPAALSLDERIDLIQKQIQIMPNEAFTNEDCTKKSSNEKRKHETECRRYNDFEGLHSSRRRLTHKKSKVLKTTPPWHSPTPPPPPTSIQNSTHKLSFESFEQQLEGDEVAEELEKLFMEQETDFEEIFGISLQTKKSSTKDVISASVSNPQTPAADAVAVASVVDEQNFTQHRAAANTPDAVVPLSNQNNQIYRQPVNDLRHSPWPCECFMQRRSLSATLTRLVEEDIRWFDILKMQFSLLFGDFGGEHDDFAPCSPTLDLDEVIISSCMRRISPWIVRHLMKPLQDGLIGNRFLFKKLAKKLAYHIIMENQYPNESVIKDAVENFFCVHRAVMTVDDLNDIDAMKILDAE